MADEKLAVDKTVQVVVFGLDVEEYAVLISDVMEVVKIPEIIPVPNSADYVAGVINLRGQVIPILDLEKRFSLEREEQGLEKHIIVIDNEESPFGVIVDEVSEVMHIPVSSVQAAPETVSNKIGAEYVRGVIVLTDQEAEDNKEAKNNSGEERILLLLDLKNVLTQEQSRQMRQVPANAVGKSSKLQSDKQATDPPTPRVRRVSRPKDTPGKKAKPMFFKPKNKP